MRVLLAPVNIHPLFWVLHYHLRLTYDQIHTQSGIPVHQLRLLNEGYSPSKSQLYRLYETLRLTAHTVALKQPTPKEQPLFREYIEAYWAVVKGLTEDFRSLATEPFRRTELSDCLISLLKPTPQLREDIIRRLKLQGFHPGPIKNCARRIKVQECVNLKSGRFEWILPTSLLAPSVPAYVPPRFIKATTPKRDQLHDRLSRILGKAPNQQLPAKEVLAQLMKPNIPNWSRPTIMRAFREMGLLRKRDGFGPGSVTYWALPHLQKEPTNDD